MSGKVRVTVEVDPDEVRRVYDEAPFAFDPSYYPPIELSLYKWRADLLRQVLDQLPPPPPKLEVGDRVVALHTAPWPEVRGRTGTVTYRSEHGNAVDVQWDHDNGYGALAVRCLARLAPEDPS